MYKVISLKCVMWLFHNYVNVTEYNYINLDEIVYYIAKLCRTAYWDCNGLCGSILSQILLMSDCIYHTFFIHSFTDGH